MVNASGWGRASRALATIGPPSTYVFAGNVAASVPQGEYILGLAKNRRLGWEIDLELELAKAEYIAKGYNPRFVVTSLSKDEYEGRSLYEDLYRVRGEMENRIKEQQLMLFADRTSANDMRANQIRLYFSSIAYVLLSAMRPSFPRSAWERTGSTLSVWER